MILGKVLALILARPMIWEGQRIFYPIGINNFD
jgi:hypothetical protein